MMFTFFVLLYSISDRVINNVYLRFLLLPCTALKRPSVLLIINTRPRRLTTWQSGWRFFALFSELRTCMISPLIKCYNITIIHFILNDNYYQ